MKHSNSKIKKFLIFSRKKLFLNFRKWNPAVLDLKNNNNNNNNNSNNK